jgi:hypothetical protein
MVTFVAFLTEWGPWILIGCGVLYLCMPAIMCMETFRSNRRLAKMESKLNPSHREFVRKQIESSGREVPPFSLFRAAWPGCTYLIWMTLHIVGGIVWLAIQ